jgi:hypothetical protein
MSSRSGFWTWQRWLAAALILTAAVLVKPVQDRIDASSRNGPPFDPDVLYFSSPAAVKALALGYDSLVADIYWMRAIQYYGRREEAARRQVRYKNLSALLDIVTMLDPEMLDVYRAGAIFLSEPDPVGAGQPLEAVRLLDKGIAHMPQEWRLRFDKGLVYFWSVKDFNKAGEVFLDASRLGSAPPWMEGMAASALSRGGAIETAKDLWRRQLEGSAREDVKDNARNHLASIQVDEDLWTIEFLVERHAALHGSPPPSLESLVRAGLLKRLPKDPSGVPYRYDGASGKASLGPESKVHYLVLPYNYRQSFRERLAQQIKY